MNPSFRLFSVRGVEIGVHYSWFLIAGLIAWSLARGFFPRFFPDWTLAQYWYSAVVATFALFASVLVHELAHSFVAQWKGIPVKSITLFIFGGVSNITAEAEQASTEFLIAVVGPLTSAAIGGVCMIIWAVTAPDRVPDAAPAQGIVLYLANVNLLLAAFNLVPGFPLDGGRVLRSIVWGVTNSEQKATRVAAWSGQLIGWAMIAYGLYLFLSGELLGGLWLAFIGWFLQSAANSGRLEYDMRRLLGDVAVKEIMDPQPDKVPPDLDVTSLVRNHFMQQGHRSALVGLNGGISGIVTLTDVHRAERMDMERLRVQDIMTSGPLVTVSPEDRLDDVLKRMVEKDVNQVPVVSNGDAVGMLSRETILRYFQLMRQRN